MGGNDLEWRLVDLCLGVHVKYFSNYRYPAEREKGLRKMERQDGKRG